MNERDELYNSLAAMALHMLRNGERGDVVAQMVCNGKKEAEQLAPGDEESEKMIDGLLESLSRDERSKAEKELEGYCTYTIPGRSIFDKPIVKSQVPANWRLVVLPYCHGWVAGGNNEEARQKILTGVVG
jgi:hypothetical protein